MNNSHLRMGGKVHGSREVQGSRQMGQKARGGVTEARPGDEEQ